jgi:hypothetical protein
LTDSINRYKSVNDFVKAGIVKLDECTGVFFHEVPSCMCDMPSEMFR